MSMALNYPYTITPSGEVVATAVPTKQLLDKVLTLLSTNVGQRPMLPDYGVDWGKALFENEGDAAIAIPQAINEAISSWLPEITVKDVNVSGSGIDGIQNVVLSLQLPNNTTTTLSINSATLNYDGIVTRY